MKKVLNLIIILIICLVIYGCENTKVTFNYNCPGVSDYSCSVLDKKLNCTFTMPKCGEKEFDGWYDASSNGNRVNLDKDFEEDTTLYAHWIDNTVDPTPIDPTPEPDPVIEEEYKVIFNVNGGNGGQTSSFEMKYEETLPRISDERPIRNGYIFKGWYDNSDYTRGIKYYDENGNPVRLFDKKNDLILYAGWEKDTSYEEPEPEPVEETKYEITFNINGGNGNTPDEINVTYNGKLPNISSSVPTRTGYEFTGWYDNSDYTKGNKYYSNDGKPVRTYNRKSDTTLYAGWKIRTYSITYNLNGGSSGQTGSLSVQYNSTLPTISKSKPTRSGFTFKGWYDNSDYTKGKQYYNENNVAVRNYDKTSNLTLYAGWSKVIVVQTYQVTFNINGGSGNTPSAVNAVLGSAMPSITTTLPTRTNYIFMGWYDNANYTKGTQYYTNKNVSARNYDKTSGITLYAGWKSKGIKASCTGEYEGGLGNAKLNVVVTSGSVSKYKFLIDNKVVQDSNSATYTADNEYVILINPKVIMTTSDGQNTTISCTVQHSNHITYNAKGYYFSAKASKDKSGAIDNPYSSNRLPYYIHIPENASPNESLPLIVGLHGGYGISNCYNGTKWINTTEASQTNHYFKNVFYYDKKDKYAINGGKDNNIKAIMLTISNTRCSWNGDMYGTMDIIHAIIKKYNVDLNHVILTGVSQGGAGTLYLGFLEEQILYKAKDNNTTLSSIASKYNTTVEAIESYNKKTKHSISYSNSSSKTLKSGTVTIIRSRNNNEPGSIFTLLMPFSPAQVNYRVGFVNVGGTGTPPHTLKTPIWVITSNDEYPKVQDMAKEVTRTYDELGDARYTVLTGLRSPHDSDTAFFNRTSAAKYVIGINRGQFKVKNNSEISSIETQMGSNFSKVWTP